MPLLKGSMTENEEEQSVGSPWRVVFALILFMVISHALEFWFLEPIAVATAGFAVSLVIYPFSFHQRVGFLKWASGALLIVVSYVGLVYGVSRPLCKQFGAVLTAGLLTFVMFMSIGFVGKILLRLRAKRGELWMWLAFSAGWGALFAFFAYINPEGFCKR